ncbi:MAG: biopolymer transporter ExbD [Planctomycetaceae bacterium]
MRIPAARSRSPGFEQTMTPLIDIVFQLLIFFVCASTGHLREFLLPTDFAAGGIAAQVAQIPIDRPISRVWVRLVRAGDVTLTEIEGTAYRPEDNVRSLLRNLAEVADEAPLILEIEDDVPVEDVVGIVDDCKSAGFQSVQFSAEASAASDRE